MEIKNLTCIGCPMGCYLTVSIEDDRIGVEGNTCPRGADYAKKEVTNPTRIVTSSVRVNGADIARVSVKTASDIPKGKIFDCMKEINKAVVKLPAKIGDIAVENILGTGANVVVTANMD